MVSSHEVPLQTPATYKLVPPDGGWGHLISASVTIMNLISIVPQSAFGLIFGSFLASVGDETTGTTLSNGAFNTVQSFTGLASSFLLQRYSYRKVGLLGALLFALGAFGIIFISDLTQMILCYGVLQGLGYGLMMPASFSAFNCYFDKKINFMMGIAQALMVLGGIAFPPAMAFCIESYGFRGTVIVMAVLSLLNFPAMGVLQPVKWHMKKVAVEDPTSKETFLKANESQNKKNTTQQMNPLLSKNLEEGHIENKTSDGNKQVSSKPRFSVISLGDRAASLTVINDLDNDDKRLTSSKCIDLSFLRSFKYINISLGVALSFNSDTAFITIIPILLSNSGYDTTEVALLIMVYFGSDLVSRILLSVVSAFFKIRNRYVFLAGSLLSAIFRIAFITSGNQMCEKITFATLGFLRCFIQTPLALVFSEEYNEQFPTAFSLYMVVCGFVSIIIGLLTSGVKSLTQSDEMVVHILTGAFLITSISWSVELIWNKMRTNKT